MYVRTVKTVDDLKAMPEWEHLSEDTRIWLCHAYRDREFIENHTDGMTWISEFAFEKPGFPPAVAHDYLNWKRPPPMTIRASDKWFRQAMTEFGFVNYGRVYYAGLRTVGIPYRLAGRFWSWLTKKKTR